MNEAAFAMIEQVSERKGPVEARCYSLTSLNMDSRFGDISESKKSVHSRAKNLWN